MRNMRGKHGKKSRVSALAALALCAVLIVTFMPNLMFSANAEESSLILTKWTNENFTAIAVKENTSKEAIEQELNNKYPSIEATVRRSYNEDEFTKYVGVKWETYYYSSAVGTYTFHAVPSETETKYQVNTSTPTVQVYVTKDGNMPSNTDNESQNNTTTPDNPEEYLISGGSPVGSETYKTILGNEALDYGIITNTYSQLSGDAETNIAAVTAECLTQTGNDLDPVKLNGQKYIFSEINTKFIIKGTNALVRCPESENNKIVANERAVIFDNKGSADQLRSAVQDMIDHVREQANAVSSKSNLRPVQKSDQKYHIDIRGAAAGTYYVSLNEDLFKKVMSEADKLQIQKNKDQTIIFNVSGISNPVMYKYSVNGVSTDSVFNGDTNDVMARSIIWNFGTGTNTVTLTGSVTGLVIAPTAEVITNATGAGWIVANKVSIGSGEWHSIYPPSPITKEVELQAKKTVEHKEPGNKAFSFSVYEKQKDGSYSENPVATAKNNEKGDIVFPFTYTLPGMDDIAKIYKITENPDSQTIDGVTYKADTPEYYAKVTYKKHKGDPRGDKYYDNELVVTYYSDEKCTNKIQSVNFNNSPIKPEVVLSVQKNFENGNWSDNTAFTFSLKSVKGFADTNQNVDRWNSSVVTDTPMPDGTEDGTVATSVDKNDKDNEENHVKSFEKISYDKDGTYYYELTESKGRDQDVSYDSNVYLIKVYVHDGKQETSYYKVNNSDVNNVTKDSLKDKWESYANNTKFTFTNKGKSNPKTATASLQVSKNLVDENGNVINDWKDQSFTFTITPKSDSIPKPENSTVTITSDTPEHQVSFDEIRYVSPGTYTYTIAEKTPPKSEENITYDSASYTATVTVDKDMNVSVEYKKNDPTQANPEKAVFNNIKTSTNPENKTIDISGIKTWDDKNNQDRKRPNSITVNLLKNGEKIRSEIVDTSKGWQYNFTNLPKYDNGKEITYTITEDAVADYSTKIDDYNITNSYTPGKTSVTVTKAWNDNSNDDKKRPASIQVQLYANGKKVGDPVTLSESTKWTYTWSDLDAKKSGTDIKYTVEEVNTPDGYTSNVSGNAKTGYTITNTENTTPPTPNPQPTYTTYSVHKVWDLGSGETVPDFVQMQLYKNGAAYGSPVTVTKASDWTYTWTGLPQTENGKLNTWSVKEVDPDNQYTATVVNGTSSATVTNRSNNNAGGKTQVSVHKVWKLDNGRTAASSVQAQLYRNGEAYGDPVTLSAGNSWSHVWTGLTKTDAQGNTISWTVREVNVPSGFTSTVTGTDRSFTITNDDKPKDNHNKHNNSEHPNNNNNKNNKPVHPSNHNKNNTTVHPGTPTIPKNTGKTVANRGTTAGSTPRTGDQTSLGFWLAMLTAGAAGTAAAVLLKRRNRKEEE